MYEFWASRLLLTLPPSGLNPSLPPSLLPPSLVTLLPTLVSRDSGRESRLMFCHRIFFLLLYFSLVPLFLTCAVTWTPSSPCRTRLRRSHLCAASRPGFGAWPTPVPGSNRRLRRGSGSQMRSWPCGSGHSWYESAHRMRGGWMSVTRSEYILRWKLLSRSRSNWADSKLKF